MIQKQSFTAFFKYHINIHTIQSVVKMKAIHNYDKEFSNDRVYFLLHLEADSYQNDDRQRGGHGNPG